MHICPSTVTQDHNIYSYAMACIKSIHMMNCTHVGCSLFYLRGIMLVKGTHVAHLYPASLNDSFTMNYIHTMHISAIVLNCPLEVCLLVCLGLFSGIYIAMWRLLGLRAVNVCTLRRV